MATLGYRTDWWRRVWHEGRDFRNKRGVLLVVIPDVFGATATWDPAQQTKERHKQAATIEREVRRVEDTYNG
jgi:hypothetical protein